MRTTLKAQAIRLIAIFLLICASTTTVKTQISQHPELYKVKEFHNMDKEVPITASPTHNTTKGSSTGST